MPVIGTDDPAVRGDPPGIAGPAGLVGVLAGFVAELRRAGLTVSPTEHIDAVGALRHVGLDDRMVMREVLAATLVKRREHRVVFDALFSVWFGRRATAQVPPDDDDEELRRLVDEVMESGDPEALARLVSATVARFSGMDASRPSGASYPVYATMRALDLDGALTRLLALGGGLDGEGSLDGGDFLRDMFRRDEYEARIRSVRTAVEAEVVRRLVAMRGPAEVSRALRRPLPEDVDLLHATGSDIAALRRALVPLSRRLATRLGRSRRHRRQGRVDVRNTIRHSLSYGGAFVEPKFRRPHPSKPELLVLADVSGSVAAFARFTLELVYAVSGQFAAVRSFVFLDGVDEVTAIFAGAVSLPDALRRVDAEADVVWADGHSDYGHALETFWAQWGSEVTGRTSVVILGDARNNYHQSGSWVLDQMHRRARRVWWLNPEPRPYWDTGDSIASVYGAQCDAMVECRTLRQLERFVATLV